MKVAGIILVSLGVLIMAAGPAGTVLGMIRAFNEIQASDAEVNEEQLAADVQLSLKLTAFGLLLGVPTALVGSVLLIVGMVGNKRVLTPREAWSSG